MNPSECLFDSDINFSAVKNALQFNLAKGRHYLRAKGVITYEPKVVITYKPKVVITYRPKVVITYGPKVIITYGRCSAGTSVSASQSRIGVCAYIAPKI